MTRFAFVSLGAVLIVLAACSNSSDSSSEGGGEIRSEEDLQRMFQAVMPDLIDALTQLADGQFASKQNGASSVACPGGGTIEPNVNTGQTVLASCSAGGVVVDATLFLFVNQVGPSSYEASFNGPLTVSGSFTGTVDVVSAYITWSDPPTQENT